MAMSSESLDPTVQSYQQQAEQAEKSPFPIFLKIGRVLVWIVYAIVLVNAILLSLAFILHLAGANPDSGFVEWVYRSVDHAMRPFRGIFPTREIGDNSVLDFSLLFAAIVYFVVALLLDLVVRWFTQRLYLQQQETARLRAQADYAVQQAAADRYAADQAVREAAAREYAAQQAAANQYAIAQAAAREALAQHAAREPGPSQAVKAKPASPAAPVDPTTPATSADPTTPATSD
jgi:uncharacterized protein YggT (Ycf19 family)